MPSFSDVTLLLPLDGADGSTTFTDASNSALTLGVSGTAQIDTAQSKWGGASLELGPSSSGLSVTPANAAFGFGTGSWTIEAWVRISDRAASSAICYIPTDALDFSDSVQLVINTSGQVQITRNNVLIGSVGFVPLNTWTHVVWTYNSATTLLKIFVDGVQELSTSVNWDFGSTRRLYIGRSWSGATFSVGHFDDIRITKDAWYTANFTPPTEAHPIGAENTVATHTSSAPVTAFGTVLATYNQSQSATGVAPVAGAGTPALNLNLSYAAQPHAPATSFGPPVANRGTIPAPFQATWIEPDTAFGLPTTAVSRAAVATGAFASVIPTPSAQLVQGASGSAFGAFGTPVLLEQGTASGFNATSFGSPTLSLPSSCAGFMRTLFGAPRATAPFVGAATGWTSTQLGSPGGNLSSLRTRSAVFRTAFGRAQAERTAA